MKIGILGTGKMGQAFGRRLAEKGHEVFIGSRDPQKGKAIAASIGPNGKGGSNRQAAEFGEILFIAWPRSAVRELIRTLGPLKDKILIDCTNPIHEPEMTAASMDRSPTLTEEVARSDFQGKIVKAFNTISSRVMKNPDFGSQKVTVFCCGDDQAAKAIVMDLAEEIGFEPVDAGPLNMARYIESLAHFMVHLDVFSGKGTEVALQLLRRRAVKTPQETRETLSEKSH